MPGDVLGTEGAVGKEFMFLVSGTVDVSAWICAEMFNTDMALEEVKVGLASIRGFTYESLL